MEGARVADELVFLRRRLREAERRLDRLRAAGEELDAGQAGRRDARQQRQEGRPHPGREAAEGQALQLLLDAGDVVGMAVADAPHGDAGDEVDVVVPVLVVEAAAGAAGHRETGIEREGLKPRRHVAALLGEDLSRAGPDAAAPGRFRHSATPIATCPRNRAARYEAIFSEAVFR